MHIKCQNIQKKTQNPTLIVYNLVIILSYVALAQF